MIGLTRGQDVALATEMSAPLARVRIGVGWDHERTAGFIGSGAPAVDLDASAVEFAGEQLFDLAFYNNPRTRDGGVVHEGDNKTGHGSGDDEVISIDLDRVYRRVDTIMVLVSSYQGHSLEWIRNAYCRLLDEDGSELLRFTLTSSVVATGVAMAKLTRAGDGWHLVALGEPIAVTIPTESVAALRPFL